MKVYVLFRCGENSQDEIIGIYGSEILAEAAIKDIRKPGWSYPIEVHEVVE
jgi:hypothetical protein